jgi:excisionase family DNA binding protein
MKPDATMTIREFCTAYRICRATFYNEVNRGNLRAVKMGTKTLVLREDVEAWVGRLPKLPTGRKAVGRAGGRACL